MAALRASTPGLARIKQARKEKGWSVDHPRWLEEASRVLGIDWENLIQLYRGNPLALNIIATIIQDLFNSNVSEFMRQQTLVITTTQ